MKGDASKLPEPNAAIELLARATAIAEIEDPGDASIRIQMGWVLVGVCPTPEGNYGEFTYSLIWPHPIEAATSAQKESWGCPFK